MLHEQAGGSSLCLCLAMVGNHKSSQMRRAACCAEPPQQTSPCLNLLTGINRACTVPECSLHLAQDQPQPFLKHAPLNHASTTPRCA